MCWQGLPELGHCEAAFGEDSAVVEGEQWIDRVDGFGGDERHPGRGEAFDERKENVTASSYHDVHDEGRVNPRLMLEERDDTSEAGAVDVDVNGRYVEHPETTRFECFGDVAAPFGSGEDVERSVAVGGGFP